MPWISKVLASRDAAAKSLSSSMSSSSDSSTYSSSDSEDAAVEEVQGVPNPPLGVQQEDASDADGEYIPNPSLNVGPPSPDADSDMERPPEVQRCPLCSDFDHLLEQHLSLADGLEKSEKKVAELQGLVHLLA